MHAFCHAFQLAQKEQMQSVQKKPCLAAAELSGEEKHGALPLLELPESALTLIARQVLVQGADGYLSMLAVSRSARDAVLRAIDRITLDLRPDHFGLRKTKSSPDYGSLGRLLQRACTEAAPGLSVVLKLEDGHGLPTLLQPALNTSNGFSRVHTLEVVTPQSSYLSFLGPAMPCLKRLYIMLQPGADIGDGGLFVGLQLCSGLQELELTGFSISPAAVQPSAAALARLRSLRRVQLWVVFRDYSNPAGLVEQLTCLTHLDLHSQSGSHMESMFAAAARNPGLQTFTVCARGVTRPTAAQFKHLLTSCPSLTYLDLNNMRISQDVLEVLLTYGTKITTLKAFNCEPEVSFADRPCSWKSLQMFENAFQHHASVLHWAHLPLKGLTELDARGADDHWLGTFQIPFNSIDLDQLPQKLRAATTNLAACPAWHAPLDSSCIRLEGDPAGPWAAIHIFSAEQRIQLLEALAPVGGPHVESFAAVMHGAAFVWDRPELLALGRSLNSKRLSSVELDDCTLTAGFWAALEEVVPALSHLTLYSYATCSASDIAGYCKRRQSHQLELELGKELWQAVDGAALQASLVGQGISHVDIKQLDF